MESFERRLERFLSGSPDEIFFTILNSIHNFAVPQVVQATRAGLHRLALLGFHAVMQTVSEQIYGRRGTDATIFYLSNFVDGQAPDTRFSSIASEIHTFRNISAHRWSSGLNYEVGFDTTLERGWWPTARDCTSTPQCL